MATRNPKRMGRKQAILKTDDSMSVSRGEMMHVLVLGEYTSIAVGNEYCMLGRTRLFVAR